MVADGVARAIDHLDNARRLAFDQRIVGPNLQAIVNTIRLVVHGFDRLQQFCHDALPVRQAGSDVKNIFDVWQRGIVKICLVYLPAAWSLGVARLRRDAETLRRW